MKVAKQKELKPDDTFEYDGVEYRCLCPIGFRESNASRPVVPPDNRKCIGVNTAIKERLIVCASQDNDVAGLELFDSQSAMPGEVAESATATYPAAKGTSQTPLSTSFTKADGIDESLHYGTGIFYLTAHYLRVQSFLARALIYPSAYDGVRGDEYNDLQSYSKTGLYLTHKPLIMSANQLVIAVFITPDEYDNCRQIQSVLLMDHLLPISRIERILVPQGEDSLETYLNGWLLEDVPVPRHLFQVLREDDAMPSQEAVVDSALISAEEKPANYSTGMAAFDRIMGSLAYMRNVARYYSLQEQMYQNVPSVYCYVTQWLIHDTEPPAAPFVRGIFDSSAELELGIAGSKVLELLHRSASAEKDTIRQIAREQCSDVANLHEVYESAMGTTEDYVSALNLLRQESYEVVVWVLVVLFHYRMKNSNDHRSIKQRISENWPDPKIAAKIMAYMGAYFGYAKLDAREYRIYSIHPEIEKVVEKRPTIKYHLDSLHDRALVESVYRRAFEQGGGMSERVWRFFEQQESSDMARQPGIPEPTRLLRMEKGPDCPYLETWRLHVKHAYDFFSVAEIDEHEAMQLINKMAVVDPNILSDGAIRVVQEYTDEPLQSLLLAVCKEMVTEAVAKKTVNCAGAGQVREIIKYLYDCDNKYMRCIDKALGQ